MKPTAIVYTSNTGYTARYAEMLAGKLHLPLYSLEQAKKTLPKHTPIVYLGWLMAGKVKSFGRVKKRYGVTALGVVGLGATGTLSEGVRKDNGVHNDTVIFELQGGMDHAKLKGIYKKMIETLIKILSGKKDRTEEENEMLEMIRAGGDFVREENLNDLVAWYEAL